MGTLDIDVGELQRLTKKAQEELELGRNKKKEKTAGEIEISARTRAAKCIKNLPSRLKKAVQIGTNTLEVLRYNDQDDCDRRIAVIITEYCRENKLYVRQHPANQGAVGKLVSENFVIISVSW